MNQPCPPERPASLTGPSSCPCHPVPPILPCPAFSSRLSASPPHRPAASPDRRPACLDRLMPCPSPSPHLARPLPTRLTGLPRLPVALPGHRFACVTHPLRPPAPTRSAQPYLVVILPHPAVSLPLNPSPRTPLMTVALPTLPSRLLARCLCPA